MRKTLKATLIVLALGFLLGGCSMQAEETHHLVIDSSSVQALGVDGVLEVDLASPNTLYEVRVTEADFDASRVFVTDKAGNRQSLAEYLDARSLSSQKTLYLATDETAGEYVKAMLGSAMDDAVIYKPTDIYIIVTDDAIYIIVVEY